jgi:hypothetical protein
MRSVFSCMMSSQSSSYPTSLRLVFSPRHSPAHAGFRYHIGLWFPVASHFLIFPRWKLPNLSRLNFFAFLPQSPRNAPLSALQR